jgi:hypothetical protein
MFHIRPHSPIAALAIAAPALVCSLPASAAERAAPDRQVRTAVEGVISAVRSDPAAGAGHRPAPPGVTRTTAQPLTGHISILR